MRMLFVTGDIHGDAARMWERVDAIEAQVGRPLCHEDEVLILGDVGLLYGRHLAGELLRDMGEAGCRWIVMRGNHDSRYCRDIASGKLFGQSTWHEVVWRGGPAIKSHGADSVLFLPDSGGLYDIDGHPSLVIPGAWSPDASWRIATRSPYEQDEQLSYSEMCDLIRLAEENPIEMVFSHSCPKSWMPLISDLFLPGIDQSKADMGTEKFLDAVLDVVSPTLTGWWFAHFHDDRDIDGTRGHLLFDGVVAIAGD